MIILLYGPDNYRRSQKLKEITHSYEQRQSLFSLERFDFDDSEEFYRFKDFAGQQLIFEGKKLAVLENAFNLEEKELKLLKEALKENVKNENVILIISDSRELPGELKFVLDEAIKTQEFLDLDEEKTKFFMRSEAKKRGVEFSLAAENFLSAFFKNNTWGLITEIDKLQSLHQESAKIEVSDLERAGDFFKSSDIYNFINAVSRKESPSEKLKSLENLFLNHEEPAMIFNFLAASRFLSFDLLKKMADYDVLVKSGRIDYETALLDACL
ncbi:MAG: hypothetical protein NUV83_01805 [Candidatus Wolfebacteria bacterium]|nr:hypothetical protein [Candidatus Wolfebacteria bacterium]